MENPTNFETPWDRDYRQEKEREAAYEKSTLEMPERVVKIFRTEAISERFEKIFNLFVSISKSHAFGPTGPRYSKLRLLEIYRNGCDPIRDIIQNGAISESEKEEYLQRLNEAVVNFDVSITKERESLEKKKEEAEIRKRSGELRSKIHGSRINDGPEDKSSENLNKEDENHEDRN